MIFPILGEKHVIMNTRKIEFKNADGLCLTGRLAMPPDRHPHNYAIFAHCFTCTKNLSAARNISNALAMEGFGVLRFDFTGLGESEGDFSNTDFSANVADLSAAATYLKEHYQAPALLIGHSLGGTAAILAAAEIPSVRAVATLGAPSDPGHVSHLLQSSLEDIRRNGSARVRIAGRDFTIKKQFLDDLQAHSLPEVTRKLGRALLILHSPQDSIVGISNAEQLYRAARHPKSFVSLDGADHLLAEGIDSRYAGKVIGTWAIRYVKNPEVTTLETDHQVVARLDSNDRFTTFMKVGNHYLTADEPSEFGGMDFGPSPYDLLSASLSACTSMTLQMYARRKGWPLESVETHTSYRKEHVLDCEACEEGASSKIDTFTREIRLTGSLDDAQKKRLLEIADRCPVHRTLHSQTLVRTTLQTP